MKIPNNILTLLALAGIVLLGLLSVQTVQEMYRADDRVENVRTINVTGNAEYNAVPDTATFTFSALAEGDTSAEATEKLAEKVEPILLFLDKQNIEENDIKTEFLNINPRYVYSEGRTPRITGYQANQSVKVVVRDADPAEIISGVTDAGADSVSQVLFDIDNDDTIRAEVRSLAIQDAEEKARVLARQLGVNLGSVVTFYEMTPENNYPQPFMARAEMMDEGAELSLPEGENIYTSTVEITYSIH
jgi:uncharacterized protein YggE